MTTIPRRVTRIVPGDLAVDGAGVKLRRTIAGGLLPHLDPFLLLDEFKSMDPDDFIRGFPWHPHRGIETVTYMIAGEVSHEDSLGNRGRLGPGDVQWMTAGKGIVHQEMPAQVDGGLWGYQLWVNLPASEKMRAPRYQDVPASEIPSVTTDDGVTVRVVTGTLFGVTGPVTGIDVDPLYADITVPAGGEVTIPTPRDYTAFAQVVDGHGAFGVAPDDEGEWEEPVHLLVFGEGDTVTVRAAEDEPVRFLFASGRPNREPIVWSGPFVMNTADQIRQAYEDYRAGRFQTADG